MKSKKIIIPILVIVVVAIAGAFFVIRNASDDQSEQASVSETTEAKMEESETSEPVANTETESTAAVSAGRYTAYTEAAVKDTSYPQTILFFYAAWCPECRAFKQAITAGAIPDGVQILEVNYDTASDLKKQHGVTIQTTFVKVDQSGNQESKWVGYGKDKSLQAVLDNL